MHDQAFGDSNGEEPEWSAVIRSSTMELIGEQNIATDIRPYDKEDIQGAREFSITFRDPVDPAINEESGFV